MLSKVAIAALHEGIESRVLSMGSLGVWGPRLLAAGIPVSTFGWTDSAAPSPITMARGWPMTPWEPHLIQGWMYHGNLGASALSALSGRPTLWNIRATWDPSGFGNKMTRAVMVGNRLLSRHPARILCNSSEAINSHLQAGFSGQWKFIANGFDTQKFRPNPALHQEYRSKLGIDDSAMVIGMAARFHPMKDHSLLLQVWDRLAGLYPNLHLLLAGSNIRPDNPWFSAQLERIQAADRIHLLGEIQDDIPAFQACLDLGVLSSAYGEAFPNAIGEALSSGVPCVATEVGDTKMVIGSCGETVPAGDVDAFSAALERMICMSSEQRRTLGALSRERILANYSIEAIAKQYGNLYREISEG